MPPIKLKLNLGGIVPPPPPQGGARRANVSDGSREGSSRLVTPDSTRSPERNSRGDDDNANGNGRVAGPGPSTIRISLGKPSSGTPSASSSSAPTPMSITPVSTPGHNDKPKKRGRPSKARPSAIPAHVISPRPPTVTRSPPTIVSTPGSDFEVKIENDWDMDPLALPWSPGAMANAPYEGSATPATPGDREGSVDTPSGRQPVKWKRIKRPFKELGNKCLQEMRRKDVYGFFLEPLNPEEYPGYLDIIGGEDKMMDLQTMQNKLDDDEYRGMSDLEADFRMMYEAATTFNLPGSAPHREANKVFNHGMKHIERAKPLILTPSPSPSPSQRPSALPDSEHGTPSAGSGRHKDVPPHRTIPEQMLGFPPNSLQALAVGWNLTGGRRVRAKRFVRGREKFVGKWRDWTTDGSRDMAEMDDPHEVLEEWRLRRGDEWRTVTDWPRIRDEDEAWWEWDGYGGPTGQPPLPGAPRIKPPTLRTRELGYFDFGVYPEVEAELHQLRQSYQGDQGIDDMEPLAQHLRPEPPRQEPLPAGWPTQNFVNIYESSPAVDYLRHICLGSTRGEAYNDSVQRFLRGAIDGAAQRRKDSGAMDDDKPTGGDIALQEYVADKWHDGVLHSHTSKLVGETVRALSAAAAKTEPDADGDVPMTTNPALAPEPILNAAQQAYSRIALRALTSARNPLDLQPLLREPADFMYLGVGGKSGVKEALGWVGNEIERMGKVRIEEAAAKEAAKVKDKSEASAKLGFKRSASDEADTPEAKRSRVATPADEAAEDASTVVPNGNGSEPTSANVSVSAVPAAPVVENQTPVEVKPSPAAVAAATPSAATPSAPTAPGAPVTAAPVPAATPSAQTAPGAPVVAAPENQTPAVPEPDPENGLRQLRLELVALSKFYPLASLRKMDRADATRLLPANVRGLMSRPP